MSKEKLLRDLTAAMAAAKTKLSASKLPDVSGDNYITHFGQENLGEYLGYVASLELGKKKIFEEGGLEKLAGSAGIASKDLVNRKLFHYFLFELHRQKAESAAVAEDQIPTVRDEGEIKGDLSDLSEKLVVGNWRAYYSEAMGLRAAQEDAFVIGAAKQDGDWENSAQVPSLLQKQFQEMGVQIRNYCIEKGELSGSTAIAAHYSKDQKLTIANLGDSRAVLFVRKVDGKVEWIRLTNDQEPNDVFEQARIEAKGGVVWSDWYGMHRVSAPPVGRGGLAVGRSFGDAFIQAGGGDEDERLISYEPDIYQHDIAQILSGYGAGSQAFLMTSCDGMYDHGKGNEATYAQALKDWFSNEEGQKKWKNNMAEYLRDYALSLGSRDNVTVCISDITEAPQQSVVTAVFDGHGGSRVSAIAAEAFAQNVLHDRSAAAVHHAQDSAIIKEIVEGRAAAEGVTRLVALAAIETQTGAEDKWEKATPIKIDEVEFFKEEGSAYPAEGGSLEKFKSSKDLVRFIAERYAKFDFKEQGEFNTKFGLTYELGGKSVEDYIGAKLAEAPKENVTNFLDEASPGAKDLQFGNDRSFHGAYHSIITTVYTGMFADFYSKHFAGKFGIPEDGLSKDQRNSAMVMTSAHDIARNTGAMLTDEHNNAFYLALILRGRYKLTEDEAIVLASHIAKKDDSGVFDKKSFYSRLTQCADCAAIVRVYGSARFNEEMLDARKDINAITDGTKKSAAEADLKLILDFAKAFEDKMKEGNYAGYEANNTTFDGAARYLRAVAKGISKDPTAGQEAFLGYLDGLSNEPKSEFISPFKAHQIRAKPYYNFISPPEDYPEKDVLKEVPVALAGSVSPGMFWQIAGEGMNGKMEVYLREMRGNVLGLANAELAKGPKEVEGAEKAIGTVQLLDLTEIEGFKQGSQVQKILYSASPDLRNTKEKKIEAPEAERLMTAFGKKFRTQLSEKGITELCLPLYSGGIYSGDHSPEEIAEWMMKGWLAAEEEPAMVKVKVYLGHPCLVGAVAKLTKTAIKDGSKLETPPASAPKLEKKEGPKKSELKPSQDLIPAHEIKIKDLLGDEASYIGLWREAKRNLRTNAGKPRDAKKDFLEKMEAGIPGLKKAFGEQEIKIYKKDDYEFNATKEISANVSKTKKTVTSNLIKWEKEGSDREMVFQVNFASSEYGGGTFGNGFVQEERKNVLSTTASILTANNSALGLETRSKGIKDKPTPVVIVGQIKDFDELKLPYGRDDRQWDVPLSEMIRGSDSPFTTFNELAIAADSLKGGRGSDTEKSIKALFNNALAGFQLAKKVADAEGKTCKIKTGLLGAGAFSNSPEFSIAMQYLAARIANVEIEFCGIDSDKRDYVGKIFERVDEMVGLEMSLDTIVKEGLLGKWKGTVEPKRGWRENRDYIEVKLTPKAKAEGVKAPPTAEPLKEKEVPAAEADAAESKLLKKMLRSKPEDSATVTAEANLVIDHELRKKLLFAACKNNRFDLISICVANGSDILEKNDEGKAPLDLVPDAQAKRRIGFFIKEQEKTKKAEVTFARAIHQSFKADVLGDKAMIANKAKCRDAFAQAVLPPDVMKDLADATVQLDTTEFLNVALDYLLPAQNKVRLSSLVKSSETGVEYKSETITLDSKLDIVFSERQVKGEDPLKLSALLNGFCKSEAMQEEEWLTIGGKKTPATKTLTPSVFNRNAEIVMALKRNEKKGKKEAEKITDQVELDNVEFAVEGSEEKQKYEATSFIRHYGGAGGGHYVTYVKESDKKWYCYNDSWRNLVEDEDLKEAMKDAYVVKYTPLGDDPGSYRTPLPGSQRSGAANAGNQCWANGAFAFLLSMTSLHGNTLSLVEGEGLDSSPASEGFKKPGPDGAPKERESDLGPASLVSAILECEAGESSLRSLMILLKDMPVEVRESANDSLLGMEMPTIEKAYKNAGARYLDELVAKFAADEDTGKIEKIFSLEALFSEETFRDDALKVIDSITSDRGEFREDGFEILSGIFVPEGASPLKFIDFAELCLKAIAEKNVETVLELLPHARRDKGFLSKALEICLEGEDEELTKILLEGSSRKAEEKDGEDIGGLEDEEPDLGDEGEGSPNLESETEIEIEIEGMKAKSGGEITLDLKDSKTGDDASLLIRAGENKFVEVVKESGSLEVRIKSEDFRKELMNYYKKEEGYKVSGGKEAKKIGKEALEVLNIYRAVPSTSLVPKTSVALTSASRIVVGDLSKPR